MSAISTTTDDHSSIRKPNRRGDAQELWSEWLSQSGNQERVLQLIKVGCSSKTMSKEIALPIGNATLRKYLLQNQDFREALSKRHASGLKGKYRLGGDQKSEARLAIDQDDFEKRVAGDATCDVAPMTLDEVAEYYGVSTWAIDKRWYCASKDFQDAQRATFKASTRAKASFAIDREKRGVPALTQEHTGDVIRTGQSAESSAESSSFATTGSIAPFEITFDEHDESIAALQAYVSMPEAEEALTVSGQQTEPTRFDDRDAWEEFISYPEEDPVGSSAIVPTLGTTLEPTLSEDGSCP